MLDLRSFVFNKLPEDSTLVPKHAGVGTLHEVCLIICVLLYFCGAYGGGERCAQGFGGEA